MSYYPDFSSHNYRIEKVLGNNTTGGRVTYLATNLTTRQAVVIKQYQFAQPGSSWVGYRAYQAEIRILRSLYCFNIPRYIDSFETSTGFCLVQEYKKAPSLTQARQFTPQEIKQIANEILEVLIYLQKQIPPVIHGDLKPDNILVDASETIKIYLVDFGFARVGSGDVAFSNVVKGTVGFMPPEEMFNRQLTKASDLYSLGATLICLLTGTKATKISQFIDEKNYRLNFKHHLPKLNPKFVHWLEKMVEPRVIDRYPNALAALQDLQTIPIEGDFSLWEKLKSDRKSTIYFLIISGIFASLVAGFVAFFFYFQGDSLRQLQQTKSCPQCNLENLNLPQANLQGANLTKANLLSAYLRESNLENANLSGANLENAHLRGINLGGANLEGAILRGANLIGANLKGASLESANLENATLDDANLVNTNLKYSQLIDAKLKYARLEGANLEGANLAGANLEGAILKGAIMPNGKRHD